MLELDKLKKDIAWILKQIRCLLDKRPAATAWSNSHTPTVGGRYQPGTLVWYDGCIYQAIFENSSIIPTNATYWKNLGEGDLLEETNPDWIAPMGTREFIKNKPVIESGILIESDPFFHSSPASDITSEHIEILNVTSGVNTGNQYIPTNTSEFINDGEDGTNPFLTLLDIYPDNVLINGGYYHMSGYKYFVWANKYIINGITYTNYISAEVTLNPADPNYDRIDRIIINSNQTIDKVTGIAAENPIAPLIDSSTQLEVTFILVTGGTVVPVGVTREQVYYDNVGEPLEWTLNSYSTTTVNPDSTINSESGIKNILFNNALIGNHIAYKNNVPIIHSGTGNLIFKIRFINSVAHRIQIIVSNSITGTNYETWITLTNFYGIDITNTTSWQTCIIPTTPPYFFLPSFDTVDFINQKSGASFRIDDVFFQTGTQPIDPGTDITRTSQLINDGENGIDPFLVRDDLDFHVDDDTIHFTQAEISITESQISDFGDYYLASNPDGFISGINVVDNNGNLIRHLIATVAGVSILETVVQLVQPVLTGNLLSIKLIAENNVLQTVTIDLSSLILTDNTVSNATYNASTNIITLTETGGGSWSINLSEFSLIINTNGAGISTITQEGVIKVTISRVGQTGEYSHLLNLPDLSSLHSHLNIVALNAVSGINTGDQDLSPYALITQLSSNLPLGLEGQVYYINQDNTNNVESSFILKEGIIVDSQDEFDSIVVEGISLESVFTTWYLFAHSNGGTQLSPPTFPGLDPTGSQGTALTQALYDSGNTWGYDPVGNRIYLTQNFGPYTGFISPKKFQNYTLEATLSSTNSDDDNIGLIIGFYVDPLTGYEHTLSVIMTLNVPQGATVSYGVYYNFSQAAGSNSYLVADGTLTLPFPTPYRGWIGSDTRLRVIRTGNTFSIKGSQFGSTVIDDATELIVDLTSDARLTKFMTASQVGFSAKSQARAYFSDIFFTGFQDYIFFPDGSGGYQTWEWNPTTEVYFLQDPKIIFAEDYFGRGRFIYSPIFGKTYYITENDNIIKIGSGNITNSLERTSSLINDGEIIGGGDRFLLASEIEGLIPPTTLDTETVLITGDVIWQSGLTFYVYATKYKINGVLREGFLSATVTLGVADATFGRIDSFIIRNNGINHTIANDSIVVVPGIPSSEPAKQVLDNESELEISFATIDANATEPTSLLGLSVENVYLENIEWVVSGATGTINANYTTAPITGAKSIMHTLPEHRKTIFFTTAVEQFVSSQAVLQFDIKLDTVWDYRKSNTLAIDVYLWRNNDRFTGRLRVGEGRGFNFDGYNTTTVQTVFLRLERFPNIYDSNTYNKIEFQYMYLHTETFKIDNIKIVDGYGGSSVGSVTTKTSQLLNDGANGVNPFISTLDISQDIETDKTSTTKVGSIKAIYDWAVGKFQALLISGTNIKTINGEDVLGSGNITIATGSSEPPVHIRYNNQALMIADQASQIDKYIYFDATYYYEYLGTTLGTIADYRIMGGAGTMFLADIQTVSGLKTFLATKFGLRNTANTFTAFFANAITANRTYTLPNKDGTVAMTSDIVAQMSGVVNYLVKFGTATTGVVSRLWDTGTFFGIGTEVSPSKDITLGNQANRQIGIEPSSSMFVGRDLIVGAGNAINYQLNSSFINTNQSIGNIRQIGSGYNDRVFLCGWGMPIHISENGGNFVAAGITAGENMGVCGGLGNDVYYASYGGIIYKTTINGGGGASQGLTLGGSGLRAIIHVTRNGNVYACNSNSDLYMQTGGTGAFVSLNAGVKNRSGLTSDINNNVYYSVYGGDIFKQTNGTGAFEATGQTARNWRNLMTDSQNNIYCGSTGGIFKLDTNNNIFTLFNSSVFDGVACGDTQLLFGFLYQASIWTLNTASLGTPDLDGGTLKLKAGTGKGTGKSRYQIVTGQKTVSGTDMQIETVRAEFDEDGNYKRIGTPIYADNASALAGGLTVGMEYRTATGIKMEVY